MRSRRSYRRQSSGCSFASFRQLVFVLVLLFAVIYGIAALSDFLEPTERTDQQTAKQQVTATPTDLAAPETNTPSSQARRPTAEPELIVIETITTPIPIPQTVPMPEVPTPIVVSRNDSESLRSQEIMSSPVTVAFEFSTPVVVPDYPNGSPLNKLEVENWVVHYTNAEREKAGLTTLMHDAAISDIARKHSQNMVNIEYSHKILGKGATDRALAAGYDCRAYSSNGSSYSYGFSENIARHPRVQRYSHIPKIFYADSKAMGEVLVDAWMNSPGHRKNILEPRAKRIGVGIATKEEAIKSFIMETVYATQNFSKCS